MNLAQPAKTITTDEIVEYLGSPDFVDKSHLQKILTAVISLIEDIKGVEIDSWKSHWRLGAIMLAARLDRRRNSPAGVESFNELGAVYVSRNDPDIAQLLEIGRYRKPQVG